MGNAEKRLNGRQTRHRRLRKKVSGTGQRPRLAVFRSAMHIYVQAVDDIAGRTVASSSTALIKKSLKKNHTIQLSMIISLIKVEHLYLMNLESTEGLCQVKLID